jgi:hypothetical protein
MARTLRKACRACTTAKRRCVVRLPQCQRCQSKQIDCIYDLEPLIGSESSTNPSQIDVYDKFLLYVSTLHLDPKRTAFKLYPSPTTQHPVVSKVPISADMVTVEYVAGELLKMAHSVALDQSAPYIHPHMKPHPRPLLLQLDTESVGQTGVRQCERLCRLLCNLHASAGPLHEILQAFQILLCHITRVLFSTDSIPHVKEKVIENMGKLAVRLVEGAPGMLPASLSRWEAWVLAEGVRRAILMSCVIRGVYHGSVRGYCFHELFIQALPLDVRTGLWTAASGDEWEELLANHDTHYGFGSPVTDLVSFHQFASAFARAPFDPGSDTFQRLLLTAHHGKGPVDRVLG